MRRRELSEIIKRSEAAAERNVDAHERSRLAFERNTLAFERVIAALDRHMAAQDRHQELVEKKIEETEELKIFIRDMNRRSERVVQDLVKGNADLVKGNADLVKGNAAFSAEQKKRTDEIVAEMRDARQESRAHREAILAMLDRLPPAQAA
jgi:hypothetical protein